MKTVPSCTQQTKLSQTFPLSLRQPAVPTSYQAGPSPLPKPTPPYNSSSRDAAIRQLASDILICQLQQRTRLLPAPLLTQRQRRLQHPPSIIGPVHRLAKPVDFSLFFLGTPCWKESILLCTLSCITISFFFETKGPS
ncbi:hypothetical protein IV203_021690 [Nitzschia inconspicua]|uniref:Uncharacterized protein n=1 Tax=Nitzschia inconspicua TaxID=303405 RepID=A0A9K3KH74_9STRA|nr:hypothetical protein IV203_022756 [Nitzschia inconspicua]KAG7343682.1 hypothetical protein IV203_021690 [Nitzschia inconspicua]